MADRRWTVLRTTTVVAVAVLGIAGCGPDGPPSTISASEAPTGLQRILGNRPAFADDTFQVFVCRVPVGTTDPVYGALTLRLPLDPATIATQMNDNVAPFFAQLSGDRYRPRFRAGTVLTMAVDDNHDECVDRAISATAEDVAATIVVADAEHVSTAPGGWGRHGTPCTFGFCPAVDTRRAMYVGGSDFHPDWGAVPLLDLIEHEIGHTLDLPHSGDGAAHENQHPSALDLMSNSAAPRELAEAADGPPADLSTVRKHGQDTLAINRLALGWLPPEDIAIVSDHGGRFNLSPSFGEAGLRLLVLPVDDETFLTVEYLTATGFDDFLPESGVAIHRIDQSPEVCGRTTGDDPCAGVDRAQITLAGADPHTDLLDRVDDSFTGDGWTISVRSVGDLLEVEVGPTER